MARSCTADRCRPVRTLLLPPAERESEFWVGRSELDPANLGFVSTLPRPEKAHLFRFDTSLPGNRNGGHAYGPARADHPRYSSDSSGEAREHDRQALIEFLKTLNVTPRSQPPLEACHPPS
jgi:hypothetical protein